MVEVVQKPERNANSLANLVPFASGNNANPGGRPKGLMQFVRGQTKDGEDLARWYLDIWHVTGEFQGSRMPLQIRMEAANWLADRGFGRPSQSVDVRIDVEQRILTLAAEMGIDPQEAATEMARVLEAKS